ncbi:succinyl-diaminopimelate desuccinylase [bacterium]|nr:succinyl-diaminopimelate desuccinylase [bacterium]
MSLLEDLVWLISVPSEIGEEEALCSAVAKRLSPRWGADSILRIGNALVVGHPDHRPLITLYGHLDTVPAQGNLKPEIRGERLHGLGASDMKSGLAVMLGLLEDDAVRSGPFNVAFIFYDKEEGAAAENGLEDVLDAVPWLADSGLAFVLEPTDLQLELGCQGAMNATLTFSGKSAHSARPWLGENAVTKAGQWLGEMHLREPTVVEVADLEFRELFSVTMAQGGIARNVIPGSFTVNLNYRFPPSLTLDEAETRLRQVASAADVIDVIDRAPAAPVPDGNELLERFIAVSGAGRTGKQAWTDVARLSARGIPAVNYGPGETAQAHQQDESVAIANLEVAFDALRAFLSA